MKLLITEEFWSICIRTGRSSVKKTAQKTFECVVGKPPPFERGRRSFSIDKVTDTAVTVTVHCADERYNRTWTLKKGESVLYRPRYFDGGYQYRIKLK